jgi:hypothetical protein
MSVTYLDIRLFLRFGLGFRHAQRLALRLRLQLLQRRAG